MIPFSLPSAYNTWETNMRTQVTAMPGGGGEGQTLRTISLSPLQRQPELGPEVPGMRGGCSFAHRALVSGSLLKYDHVDKKLKEGQTDPDPGWGQCSQ